MSVSSAPRKKPAPEKEAPPATVADLLKRLGVPSARVRLCPPVGTATELDLIATNDKKECLVELVDGVLVEKAIGFDEANWTAWLLFYVCDHVLKHDLGRVYGPNCGYRLAAGLVRLPGASFLSWDSHRKLKRHAQLSTVPPDLAADVLRHSNTKREIARKLGEYFTAGVRLAWIVDPKRREVRVHSSATDFVTLTAANVLDGGDALPGFRLPLAEYFDQAERKGPAK